VEFQNKPNVTEAAQHKPERKATVHSTGPSELPSQQANLANTACLHGLERKLTHFTKKKMLGSFRPLSLLITINLTREG